MNYIRFVCVCVAFYVHFIGICSNLKSSRVIESYAVAFHSWILHCLVPNFESRVRNVDKHSKTEQTNKQKTSLQNTSTHPIIRHLFIKMHSFSLCLTFYRLAPFSFIPILIVFFVAGMEWAPIPMHAHQHQIHVVHFCMLCVWAMSHTSFSIYVYIYQFIFSENS